MAEAIFSAFDAFYVYVVEAPIILAIVLIFLYVMYSLNLFRKE